MKVKTMKLDNGKEIKQIITKEFGRKLIMKAPLSEIEFYSTTTSDSSAIPNHRFFVNIMNNSMKVNVLSHLTLISLFNDCCVSCGKPFTHYAIIESDYEQEKMYHKKTYSMIPCRLNNNNGTITYQSYSKDHIIPKSRFGSDTMNNYQFMCKTCNCQKSHSISDEDMKYGDYNYGIFKKIQPKQKYIAKFGKIDTKLIKMEHHCGGLFYIRFEKSKYDGYYKPNGKNVLNELYTINKIEKIDLK